MCGRHVVEAEAAQRSLRAIDSAVAALKVPPSASTFASAGVVSACGVAVDLARIKLSRGFLVRAGACASLVALVRAVASSQDAMLAAALAALHALMRDVDARVTAVHAGGLSALLAVVDGRLTDSALAASSAFCVWQCGMCAEGVLALLSKESDSQLFEQLLRVLLRCTDDGVSVHLGA